MKQMTPADFMREAIEQAELAKKTGDWPFGAVVVHAGQIVGRGRAMDKTTGDVTDHAEMVALRSACRTLQTNDLQNCTIYCTNEPCLMCAATVFQANIAKVVIGANRHDLSHLLRPRNLRIDDLAADSRHKIEISRGLLKAEVLSLFQSIQKKPTST